MNVETLPVEGISNEYQGPPFTPELIVPTVSPSLNMLDFGPFQLHAIQHGPTYNAQFHSPTLQVTSYNTNTVDLSQTLASPTPPAHSGAAQTSTPSSSPNIPSAQQNHRNRPPCSHCGRTHTRPVRYKACRDKHLGLHPFVCAGRCGKPSW